MVGAAFAVLVFTLMNFGLLQKPKEKERANKLEMSNYESSPKKSEKEDVDSSDKDGSD